MDSFPKFGIQTCKLGKLVPEFVQCRFQNPLRLAKLFWSDDRRHTSPEIIRKQMNNNNTEFDGFISYNRADGAFAAALEKALEKYRIPKSLGVEKKHLNIFRDEGDMSGSEYYSAIDRFLDSSKKLVLICSPESRNSQYVNDEVRRFIEKHGTEHIIPVLIRGKANNEVEPDAFDAAFPDALMQAMEMPLAASFLGWTPKQKLDRGPYSNAWFTLLANLLEQNRDVVEQRELKRRSFQKRMAGLAAVLALGISIGIGYVGNRLINQANEASEEAELQTLQVQATRLANQAEVIPDKLTSALILTNLSGLPEVPKALEIAERTVLDHIPVSAPGYPDLDAYLSELSPNDKYVAIGSTKSGLELHSLNASQPPRPLMAGQNTINVYDLRSLTFSPDSRRLAALTRNGRAWIWATDTGKLIRSYRGLDETRRISFSDESLLAVTAEGLAKTLNPSTIVRNVINGGLMPEESDFSIKYPQLSASGRYAVTVPGQGGLLLWGLNDLQPIRLDWDVRSYFDYYLYSMLPNFRSPSDTEVEITFITINETAETVAAAASNGHVRVWSFTGEVIADLESEVWTSNQTRIEIANRGSKLLLADRDRVVIWDTKRNSLKRIARQNSVESLGISNNGRWAFTITWDGTVTVWDTTVTSGLRKPGQKGVVVEAQQTPLLTFSDPEEFSSVKFTGDSTSLVTMGKSSGVRVWAIERQKEDTSQTIGQLEGQPLMPFVSQSLFKDSRYLVLAAESLIHVYDLQDPSKHKIFDKHEEPVVSITAHPEADFVVSSTNEEVLVWNIETNQLISRIDYPADDDRLQLMLRPDGYRVSFDETGTITVYVPDEDKDYQFDSAAGLSPDGAYFVLGYDGNFEISNSKNEIVTRFNAPFDWPSIIWSKDSQQFALFDQMQSGVEQSIEIYSLDESLSVAKSLPNDKEVRFVDFSHDGEKLIVVTDSESIVFSIDTGDKLAVLPHHEKMYQQVAFFSLDDSLIMVFEPEGDSLAIWNSDGSGEPRIIQHPDRQDIFWALPGSQEDLFTIWADGSVLRWQFGLEGHLNLIRARTNACLSAQQRQQYLLEQASTAEQGYAKCERGFGRR